MGNVRNFLHVFLFILPIVIGIKADDPAGIAVNEAADELMRRYSVNRTVFKSRGLTSGEFFSLLAGATSHSVEFLDNLVGDCKREDRNCSWKSECPGIAEIFNHLAVDGYLKADGFIEALPVALNTLTSVNCSEGANDVMYHGRQKQKPTMAQAWGYSIGFVTIIILISNIGACLGPIMQKRFFKRLLQFLVAMGAGSLVSTGLLVLIPEAFDLMAIEELGDDYVWKATAAVMSIYAFFSLERVLKTLRHKQTKHKRELLRIKSITVDPPDGDMKTPLKSFKSMEEEAEQAAHGHSHGGDDKSSLAWMIMAGDALHKAVDGLSIGAAFTEDITLGMSIALAICCEEVPHELADIAILLHSGLSIKRSLFVNCLSALFCYVGLVVGVLVGATSATASQWIFAVAGGLFLYVPMVDMLPDMSNHLDILLYQGNGEATIVAFLHTAGLLIGAGIIVLISNVSGYIVV